VGSVLQLFKRITSFTHVGIATAAAVTIIALDVGEDANISERVFYISNATLIYLSSLNKTDE
jgi:hypothetical protein